jgi:hypothetical protein
LSTDFGFVQSPPGLVTFSFNGVDRDRRGTLHVDGDAANVIYEISRRL